VSQPNYPFLKREAFDLKGFSEDRVSANAGFSSGLVQLSSWLERPYPVRVGCDYQNKTNYEKGRGGGKVALSRRPLMASRSGSHDQEETRHRWTLTRLLTESLEK
jgi:hypothetical protein